MMVDGLVPFPVKTLPKSIPNEHTQTPVAVSQVAFATVSLVWAEWLLCNLENTFQLESLTFSFLVCLSTKTIGKCCDHVTTDCPFISLSFMQFTPTNNQNPCWKVETWKMWSFLGSGIKLNQNESTVWWLLRNTVCAKGHSLLASGDVGDTLLKMLTLWEIN